MSDTATPWLEPGTPLRDLAARLVALLRDSLATRIALPRPRWGRVGWGPTADTPRPVGSVALVGAGPGDPELLTVAAVRALSAAEVVLYDHLVGPGILDLVPAGAERICVGKRSGRHSTTQEAIGDLMARHALAGRRVVRLKGGDPMMFGRAGEELDRLREAGVPVRVIPGITAALGCAASAGVSLTRRGVSRGVRFITAHGRAGEDDPIDWNRAADPQATLAVYMGRDRFARIAASLMAGGLPADTPVLVIENGTRPDERRFAGTLATLPALAAAVGDGPALLLVGRAVAPAFVDAPAAVTA